MAQLASLIQTRWGVEPQDALKRSPGDPSHAGATDLPPDLHKLEQA